MRELATFSRSRRGRGEYMPFVDLMRLSKEEYIRSLLFRDLDRRINR